MHASFAGGGQASRNQALLLMAVGCILVTLASSKPNGNVYIELGHLLTFQIVPSGTRVVWK